MSRVPSDGVGLCANLYNKYSKLPNKAPLRKMVDEMSDQLMENCQSGNQYPRDRIPSFYFEKYGVNNLYRYRLSGGYRGIYTVLVENGITNCWILDVLNHSDYETRFGYSSAF